MSSISFLVLCPSCRRAFFRCTSRTWTLPDLTLSLDLQSIARFGPYIVLVTGAHVLSEILPGSRDLSSSSVDHCR